MSTSGRTLPKVYARRPACKWHGYDCHRPVEHGTLCPTHTASAKATAIANRWIDTHGAEIPPEIERLFDGVAADPGCDCSECLRRLET